MTTIGSLCSGYEGLGMAIQQVIGGDIVWHAETDKDASAILAHHWPTVPNHGDLTTLAWADHPVDVLAAGFPCQPVSHAGKRAGTDDARWLFDDIVAGIGRMDPRPRLLVFENVLGLLSANGGHAMARVVHGLASVCYVGRWRTVRASDAGAPHQRRRVFIVATPADAGGGHGLRVAAERGALAAADPSGERHGRGQDSRSVGRVDREDAGGAREQERSREVAGDRDAAALIGGVSYGRSDSPLGRVPDDAADRSTRSSGRHQGNRSAPVGAWGQYEPAIRRWERLTRPAPAPTEPGKTGQPRLSPRFVEWMMGLPDGHITDPAIGISRNAMLKALGNGVVPAQAALALRMLLTVELVSAA